MSNEVKQTSGLFGHFRAFIRMCRAWKRKEYRVFPWRLALSLALALAYLLDPFDIIPDYIPFIGMIDDAAMFGLVVGAAKKEVDKYLAWESAGHEKQILF